MVQDEEEIIWEDNLDELVERLIGEEVYDQQRDYMLEIKKPRDVSVKQWLTRLKTINTYLPFLSNGGKGTSFSEAELVKMITKNMPRHWKTPFRLAGGHRLHTVLGARHILLLLEKQDKMKNTNEDVRGKDKGRDKGKGNGPGKKIPNKTESRSDKGTTKNPCGIPGHQNHEWGSCIYNPKSDKFKGEARTPKDYDKDGKFINKKIKKEENNRIEKKTSFCLPCDSDSDDDDSSRVDYNSDTTEEFNYLKDSKDTEKESQPRSAEILLAIPDGVGSKSYKIIVCLADTGTSTSLGNSKIFGPRSNKKKKVEAVYQTQVGTFETSLEAQISGVRLPQFTTKRDFPVTLNLFEPSTDTNYAAIIGRDLMQELGLDILFSSKAFRWGDIEVPMVEKGYWTRQSISTFTKDHVLSRNQINNEQLQQNSNFEECAALSKILAAKYEPINVKEVISKQNHLSIAERLTLERILRLRIKCLEGKRGNWKGKPVSLELLPDVHPCTARPFPIPQAYQQLVKDEVNRLVEIGLLTPVSESRWQSPSFAIPKKDNTIRFVTDFRQLNKRLVRKPYPLPLIQDILHNVGTFRYATCIDLVMGYYSMWLDKLSREYCTTCLPWGLYRYNMLPMGVKVASDVFQAAMAELFNDLNGVIVYIDDIIILGTEDYEDHVKIVSEVLRRLEYQGMQVNPLKSFWAVPEVEYLGFLIIRNGICPQKKKIQGILQIAEPKELL